MRRRRRGRAGVGSLWRCTKIGRGEQRRTDVGSDATCGLVPDVAPGPKSATSGLTHPSRQNFFDHLVDAVVAETPFEAGVTEPAVAIGGSAIVRTDTATVAIMTLRPAEESNPLRINISNPSS